MRELPERSEMAKVHAIRTGSVRIKIAQMSRRGHGLAALGHILIDRDWSEWVPIHAWLIEHDEGLILVDTGETARVHQRGYHPRWHPFFRRASQFQVTPQDEIGAQLQGMGVRTRDIRHVVLTHLHTDHAGGLAHVVGCRTWLHPIEWRRAKGIGGQVHPLLEDAPDVRHGDQAEQDAGRHHIRSHGLASQRSDGWCWWRPSNSNVGAFSKETRRPDRRARTIRIA